MNIETVTGNIRTKEVYVLGNRLDPHDSQKLRNHSPDGFMWGYAGSGPAQLALAILLALYGRSAALRLYQPFKEDVIANLSNTKSFELTKPMIDAWVKLHGGPA